MSQPQSIEASTRLLSAMLRERESVPRALLMAQEAANSVSGGVAVVYLLSGDDPPMWNAKATAGEVRLEEASVPADSGPLGTLAKEKQPLLFSGNDLVREDYAHLHVRRTLLSLAYIPVLVNDVLVGALEVASF